MRYLLLIYGDESTGANMNEQEQAAAMDKWMTYTNDFQNSGKMLGGEALMPSSTATTVRGNPNGSTMVTDGPFAESKETLGGYYMIEAANLDEALEWAKKMPNMSEGGAVEIRPIMEFS